MRRWDFDSNVKRSLGIAAIALGLSAGVVTADPPPDPPPCDVALAPVFCIRLTDIEGVAGDAEGDRFRFEFEFINWTGQDASNLLLSMNTARFGASAIPAGAPFLAGASIDSDGRPIGVGQVNPPGPNTKPNDWTEVTQTATRVLYSIGTGTALGHPSFAGTSGGNAATFDGLLDPDFASPTTQTECIAALVGMIPNGTETAGPTVGPAGPEDIDDGTNVLDGFVIEVDDFGPGEELSFNWHLLDGNGAIIGQVDLGGAVTGDQYGFGTYNLTRLASDAPALLFNRNTGYDPANTNDPNADNPLFWAEEQDEFGVDQHPINPIPDGEGAGTWFAVEFGAAVTARFKNLDDNDFDSGENIFVCKNDLACYAGCLTCDEADLGCSSPVTSTAPIEEEDNFVPKMDLALVRAGVKLNRFQLGVRDILVKLNPQPVIVEIATVQDAIAAIQANPGSNVVIFGHGAPGVFKIGEDILSDSQVQTKFTIQVQGLIDSLALYGCDVGTGDEGQVFLKKLTAALGIPVKVWTGKVYAFGNDVVIPPNMQNRFFVESVDDKKEIPAVSAWGLVVMCLLVLAAGTIVMTRRRTAVA